MSLGYLKCVCANAVTLIWEHTGKSNNLRLAVGLLFQAAYWLCRYLAAKLTLAATLMLAAKQVSVQPLLHNVLWSPSIMLMHFFCLFSWS